MSSKKKASDVNGEELILEYLKRTNRPYSAIDIFNNLKEKIPKTAVVKICNQLVEDRTSFLRVFFS